ncbi:MAG: MarR family transcriptional regulator [Sphingomonadales bacterium]|nr:MarR family transcriptional regulator [Sphingomonadales bacterium]
MAGSDDPSADTLGDLDGIVGFHIRLAHGAVYRHFTETFADLGLTQKQVSVLMLVDRNPGMAQTGLATQLQMDRATTMAIVNRLQARGYLVRGKSRVDGRMQTLDLTDAGRAALADARQAIAAHEAWLKARYTPAEVRKLIELLARLHG